MDYFSLEGEFDKMDYFEESESVNIYGNFIEDPPFLNTPLFSQKNDHQTIQHILSIDVMSAYEFSTQIAKQQLLRNQNQKPSQTSQQVHFHPYLQNSLSSRSDKSKKDSRSKSEKECPKKQTRSQRSVKDVKSRKIKKQQKNQYDKNIPGHLVSTVVNQILKPSYKPEIQFYCQQMKNLSQNKHVNYQNVMQFASKVSDRSKKFGTSQLGHFFCEKQPENDMQKVFGLFMVRFLRQQYLLHILRVGKMSNKQKYLEYATNMMYIPRLRQEEYSLIHLFDKKDV